MSPYRAKTTGNAIRFRFVPIWNRRPPWSLSIGPIFPRVNGAEVMQTAAASGHRRIVISELPEMAPGDPTGPRFLVEDIYPSVDGGRYPIKRIVGEPIEVWADLLREGHDQLAAELLWRKESEADWRREPMRLAGNDRWHGSFTPPEPGRYLFAIEAWTDQFGTWRKQLLLKRDAGLDLTLEAREGRELLGELNARDAKNERRIERARRDFDRTARSRSSAGRRARGGRRRERPARRPDPQHGGSRVVDRPRARAGAWYEMVPRSQGTVPGQHGTFDDCIARLPEIAALGFDVVYLTPIHPIGMTNRKGSNNSLKAGAGRSRQSLRDRQLAGRPRRRASRARHARRLPPLRRCLPQARHGGGARLRDPVLAGSSLAEGASGLVQAPAGRLDPLRGKPAEEIRGHRQSGFLLRRPHRAVAGAARRHPVLGRSRASTSSASTIRTPSRSRSGNG